MEDRAQRIAEQILEDSSLTGELDDAEASRLLKWGLVASRLLVEYVFRPGSADEAEAEELLDTQLSLLRRAMRKINKLVGSLGSTAPEMAAVKLFEALELAARLPGVSVTLPTDPLAAATSMRGLAPSDALESILNLLTVEEPPDDQEEQFATEE